MKNRPSAKSMEISKKGPDSEAWKRRSRLIQEAEFRSNPQALELKTEVEELKRTVAKLKRKLKDRNALEERLARLEAAAEKSSGKYYIAKEEAETLFRTLDDRKGDEILKIEHMNQVDLHHAKCAANFRQMTNRLMDSIFGNEMRNNTIYTLDSANISLITRYVMLCRATMELECTERSIRYKIRRCLDNRALYQKRNQTGKLRKPPVKTPKRKDAPEVAFRSSLSSDDDDRWNNTTVKKLRLSGTNEMLDQEVSDY